MKDITEFKTNFKKIKAFAGEDYIKACPETYLIPPYTQEEKACNKEIILKKWIQRLRKIGICQKTKKRHMLLLSKNKQRRQY